jgi:hypothetical protein
MSHTRGGLSDWTFGNVTNAVWNPATERMDVDEVCVDNSNPETVVEDMDATLSFNNGTKTHTIHVGWTWPEVDEQGPLTWNLYRTQVVVDSVTYMEPLQIGLQGEPGEEAWFNETESGLRQSIKVEQFYYYVLVPFDEVDNSDYLAREDNAVGIEVEDMFWDYHVAPPPPPEPEPPSLPGVGPSPWYGRFLDDISAGRFQQAAVVCTALMVMNLLLIPMLINKYKEQKIKAKRKRARAQRLADSDEFADDLEDFFD